MKIDFDQCAKIINEEAGDILTPDQAKELTELLHKRMINLQEEALDTAEALLREVAKDFISNATTMNMLQRRNALLTIRATREIKARVKNFKTPGEGLLSYLEGSATTAQGSRLSVERQRNAIEAKITGDMLQRRLQEQGVIDDFVKGTYDKEVVKEFYKPGSTNNQAAVKIHGILMDINKTMVDRQNRAGALIHFLPEHFGRQTYDPVWMRQAFLNGNRQPTPDQFKKGLQKFKDFIYPLIDKERTFGEADPDAFLKSAFTNILEGVYGPHVYPKTPAEVNSFYNKMGSLAKKTSTQRLFHFKDGEAAFEVMQVLGKHSLKDSVLSGIRYSSTATALMENFGPNPEHTFQKIIQDLRKNARDRHDNIAVESLSGRNALKLESAYKKISGELDRPADPSIHRWTASVLAITDLSKMGGVTLSALPDPAFLYSTATFNGAKTMDALSNMLGFFTGVAKGNVEQKSRLLGAKGMLDSFHGSIASRFSMHEAGAHRALFRLNQSLFKLNGMNWWNDRWSMVAIEGLTTLAGRDATLPFDKLPTARRNMWNMMNIAADEWDAIRATAYSVNEAGEANPLSRGVDANSLDSQVYITPDQFKNIPDAQLDAMLKSRGFTINSGNRLRLKDSIETKYRAWLNSALDESVLKPGTKEARILSAGTQSGTYAGSFWRMLTHFKSFPLTVYTKIIRRELLNGSPRAKSIAEWLDDPMKQGKWRMLQLIAITTIGGYLSGVLKDSIKGRTPKKLIVDNKLNAKVLTDAMIRGGGMGIFGDFLFTEYDRAYNTPLSAVAGPVFGEASQLIMNITDTARGEDTRQRLYRQLRNNTPLVNLFYIRPVLDYLIFYNIQEMLEPGSVHKMEHRIKQNTGQDFFISPSDNLINK